MNENTTKAYEFYLKELKKNKIELDVSYDCNLEISSFFSFEKQKINKCKFTFFKGLELSPIIICELEKENIMFASKEFILDSLDRSKIIDNLDSLKLLETYDIKLLKEFKKCLNLEKK